MRFIVAIECSVTALDAFIVIRVVNHDVAHMYYSLLFIYHQQENNFTNNFIWCNTFHRTVYKAQALCIGNNWFLLDAYANTTTILDDFRDSVPKMLHIFRVISPRTEFFCSNFCVSLISRVFIRIFLKENFAKKRAKRGKLKQ